MPSTCARSRLARFLAVAVPLSLALGGAAQADAPPTCLRPPVAARVTTPFQAPACTWCPGNRGLEYGTAPGTAVRAAAAGTVSFAGAVAGSVWVTVAHPGSMLTSYGPLRAVLVRRGAMVAASAVVGITAGALHLGVRLGGRYVDPAPLLGLAVHLVPRLVPLYGRIPPPPDLRCPAGGAGSPVR